MTTTAPTYVVLPTPPRRAGDETPDRYAETARLMDAVFAPDKNADLEDSREGLVRLHAIRQVIDDTMILLLDHHGDTHRLSDTTTVNLNELVNNNTVIGIGGTPQGNHLNGVLWPQTDTTEHYNTWTTFHTYSGRDIYTLEYDPEDGLDDAEVMHALTELAQHHGATTVICKLAGPKYPLLRTDIDDLTLAEITGWSFTGNTHRIQDVMIQEVIDMTDEYRCFLDLDAPVGHKVVTAAGCIEDHTPLDMTWGPHDVVVERHRNQGNTRIDHSLTRRYVITAEKIAADLAAERSDNPDKNIDRFVVCDLATNADTGEIIVIEFNNASASGLYASDPVNYIASMVDHMTAHDQYKLTSLYNKINSAEKINSL